MLNKFHLIKALFTSTLEERKKDTNLFCTIIDKDFTIFKLLEFRESSGSHKNLYNFIEHGFELLFQLLSDFFKCIL